MKHSKRLTDALIKKYEANMSSALATMAVYLDSPVGIGEHPQILDELDKMAEAYADAKGKLEAINDCKLYISSTSRDQN